jgi:hypothetical protein
LRYGIRDKRPCLTPWQRILHEQERSLEHFPKRCPSLRESGPSVMSHLIHYKSDSVEPLSACPLSPKGEGRFNSNSSTITRNGLFEIPPNWLFPLWGAKATLNCCLISKSLHSDF